MKTSGISAISILLSFSLLSAGPCYAAAGAGMRLTRGVVAPASSERITLVERDHAVLNVGQMQGILKGDIGSIAADPNPGADELLGRCAVQTTEYASSTCLVLRSKREIEKGYYVFFEPVKYIDATLFPITVKALSEILSAREAYEPLRVMVYGFFDEKNAITGFSDEIVKEFKGVLSQKERLELVQNSTLEDLVFYPPVDKETGEFVKAQMKKGNIDILIVGSYSIKEGKIDLVVRSLDMKGFDKAFRLSFPMQPHYSSLASTVVLTARQPVKVQNMDCSIELKVQTFQPTKEERVNIVKREAAGNKFTELSLRRIDFNIVSPVDIKVMVDGEAVGLREMKEGRINITVPKEPHRLSVSFKRGFFFNEALLYTSSQEIVKEAVIHSRKGNHVLANISLSPGFEKDPIAIKVYSTGNRQRQLLRTIYRLDAEQAVETFKD